MKIYNSEELKLIIDIFDFEEKNALDNDLKSLISEIKEMFLENQKLLNELQEKENIIKEVREYIKQNEFYLDYKTGACIKGVVPILEILDKENKE